MASLEKMAFAPKVSRRKSLTSEVIDRLKAAIVEGQLQPGMKLPTEQKLAEEMDVSRTVVREAVAALKADGLVKTRQGVGAFVVGEGEASQFRVDLEKLSFIENVLQLLELRIAFETDMAGLAAKRRSKEDLKHMKECLDRISIAIEGDKDSVEADFAFHLAIAKATQNEYFVKFVRFMGTKTVPERGLLVEPKERAEYVAVINAEHTAIYEAIADQDFERARVMARLHLMNSYERHSAKAQT